MFQWFYWHALLPGRDIPGIGPTCRPPASAQRPLTRPHLIAHRTPRGAHDDDPNPRRPRGRRERRGLLRTARPVGPRHGAVELARDEGIDPLTDRHWQVIDFMRQEYFEKGTGPTVRMLGKTSGVTRQGALPALPEGPGQDRRQDRRHPQASRLHLRPTDVLHHPTTNQGVTMADTIEKVSIVISKGSLDGIYPGLIMANGARAEGIEANLFFTFFGLDAIHKKRMEHIKIATVGNPGMHMTTLLGGLPGMSGIATHMLEQEDGRVRHPVDPRVHRAHLRHRGGHVRLPGLGRPVRDGRERTSSTTSAASSPWASSTRWLPAARSSSPEGSAAAASGLEGVQQIDAGDPPGRRP